MIQVPNSWVVKYNIVYWYSRILVNNKKEWKYWYTNNMNEPWKYYPKWKSQTQRLHINVATWFYLHQMSQMHKSIETETTLVVAKLVKYQW